MVHSASDFMSIKLIISAGRKMINVSLAIMNIVVTDRHGTRQDGSYLHPMNLFFSIIFSVG